MLLLARSAGEWWDRLAAGEPAVRELLAAAGGGEPLPAAVSGELSNDEVVAAAVPAFAAALGCAPARVEVEARSGAVRVLDCTRRRWWRCCGRLRDGGPVRVPVGDVLDELLGHEERFWQGTAERLGLLRGVRDDGAGSCGRWWRPGRCSVPAPDEAVELLGRVPGCRGR